MNLNNRENMPYKITPAICLSLLIHVAVAALLIFSPSKNVTSLPSLNGLNLAWVSLDANNYNSGIALQKELPGSILTINKRHGSEAKATLIVAARKSANTIKLASHETYESDERTGSSSRTEGYSSNQNIVNPSGAGAVTAYPLYRNNMPPAYPEIARVRGYEGVVLIAAEILPTGCVGSVKIRRSSGYAILDQSALEAVKPWKFEPAKKSSRPFTLWVEVPIKFVLYNDKSSS
jgi:TonB family protein